MVESAISSKQVRGAPLIGVTAAYGMSRKKLEYECLVEAANRLLSTRPTAVNLRHVTKDASGRKILY